MMNDLQYTLILLFRTLFLTFFTVLFLFRILGYRLSNYKKKLELAVPILIVGCFIFILVEDDFIEYLNKSLFPSFRLVVHEYWPTNNFEKNDNNDKPQTILNKSSELSIPKPKNTNIEKNLDKKITLSYQFLNKLDNNTTFGDVAGVKAAKEKLNALIFYLNDPKEYTRLGARPPNGLLLYGPPGTGKTLLARALAGEAKANFIAVSGASFDEQWVGVGAMRVRELFELARNCVPVIVFIDELDALAPSREFRGTRFSGKAETLAEMLNEMDNIDKTRNKDVFIVAATNRIQDIDSALLRSGRLDWHIAFSLPNERERTEILKIHLKKVKYDPKLNLTEIAQMTTGFSGADIENIINEAVTIATLRKLNFMDEAIFNEALANFKKNRKN